MRFQDISYSADTVALMGLACDQAWQRLREQQSFSQEADALEARNALAMQVMAAVAAGERDPDRLTAQAIHAMDPDKFPAPADPLPQRMSAGKLAPA